MATDRRAMPKAVEFHSSNKIQVPLEWPMTNFDTQKMSSSQLKFNDCESFVTHWRGNISSAVPSLENQRNEPATSLLLEFPAIIRNTARVAILAGGNFAFRGMEILC
jgi:hypothetical protein